MRKLHDSVTYGVSILAMALAAPAWAQGTTGSGLVLEEVVVTAQKRSENLQKVPVAVTAFSGDAIAARGFRDVMDLGNLVAGVQMGKSSNLIQPFVRGVGNASSTVGNESSVAMYIDGLYFSRLPLGSFSLANVERVEVLKGPQGTLFGRNSSGGVIQIITKDPSFTPTVKGEISYGRFDTIEGNLYAAAGITDKLAADISFAGRSQNKGWGTNIVTGAGAGYLDDYVVRSKWMLEVSDKTKITVTPFLSWSRSSQSGNVFPGTTKGVDPRSADPTTEYLPLPNYYDHNEWGEAYIQARQYGVSGKIEQDVGFAKLTSITGYVSMAQSQLSVSTYDERPDIFVKFWGDVRQFTQELQLASLPDSPLTWIVGGYYFNAHSWYPHANFRGRFQSFGGFNSDGDQWAKSYNVYGQATYEILPRLKVTGGIRYTADRNHASGRLYAFNPATQASTTPLTNPPPAQQDINKVTFKGAADYQLTDDVLAYVSFSRGYKGGVFNLLTYNPVPNLPEINDAWEVGFKTDLMDHRVRLNAAAWWDKLKNPQVQLIVNNSVVFSNAPASRSRGFEFEAQAAVTEGLTTRATLAYIESQYTNYPNAPTGGGVRLTPPYGTICNPFCSVNAAGRYTPFSPKLTFDVGFDYSMDTSIGSWMFTLDYAYNSGYYSEPDNLLFQPSFGLLNGQIKYSPNDHYAVKLWGRNLGGEKYFVRASSTAGYVGYNYQPGEPRTYGIAVDFNF